MAGSPRSVVAALEALPRSQGLRSSALRKPLSLREEGSRILVEPDGTVGSLDSLGEKRSLFGREELHLYKVQAGVVVKAQKQEPIVRAGPRSAQFAGRVFEAVEILQTVGFFHGKSTGYVRKVKLRNGGAGPIRLRIIDIADPTAAQLRESSPRWGSIGLNAFNRGSHIAMDEVSEPPSARVMGSQPQPSKFYMSTDRSRVLDFVRSGELPDAIAGMSGQVLIASLHDFELQQGETQEVTFAFIYSPTKLEDALADFGHLEEGSRPAPATYPAFFASSPAVTEAAAWALALVEGTPHSQGGLDNLEAFSILSLLSPQGAWAVAESWRPRIAKDGSVPHSQEPAKPGLLETALLLQGLGRLLLLSGDKKMVRSKYPLVKKLAGYLLLVSKDHVIRPDPSVPQGWRRLLGRGFPSGEIPEITLAVAEGLAVASQVARRLSKPDDATRFRERAEMVTEGVRKRLVDDRGYLALCLDSGGRLKSDETIDSAVAAYRHPFSEATELAVAHRLLEKDFETPYGPRTVPKSNAVYFNGSYGSGQLGGYWGRASLAHALLCYRLGLAGIGSLSLQKVAKLVTEDAVRLGGSPGDFPLWVDVEAGRIHGEESDVVSAARFIEGIVAGELGLTFSPDAIVLSPSPSSAMNWILASDLWLGEKSSVFLGRGTGRVTAFASPSSVDVPEGFGFAKSEALEPPARGVSAITFYDPGQVVCLGNSGSTVARGAVGFSPRAAELSTRLTTSLESYDQAKGTWSKVGSLRVLPRMTFEASLGPGEWKAFRFSNL